MHGMYMYSGPSILQPFIVRHIFVPKFNFVYNWTFILRPPAV